MKPDPTGMKAMNISTTTVPGSCSSGKKLKCRPTKAKTTIPMLTVAVRYCKERHIKSVKHPFFLNDSILFVHAGSKDSDDYCIDDPGFNMAAV